jgi:transposase
MELVSRNYLPVCYQPTEEERLLREQLRFRTKLMRSKTQYKNVAHALMDKENKGSGIGSTKKRKQAQEHAGLHPERQQRLRRALEVINFLEEQMNLEDKELVEWGRSNSDVNRLKTIPGVGDLSALMLVAELGDVSRFRKAKNVGSYLGLVPRKITKSNGGRCKSSSFVCPRSKKVNENSCIWGIDNSPPSWKYENRKGLKQFEASYLTAKRQPC